MIGVPLGSKGTGFGTGIGLGLGTLGSGAGIGVVGVGICGGGVGMVGIGESGGTSTFVVVFFFFLGAQPLLEVKVTKEINNNGSNNSFIRNSTATRFTDVKSLDSTFGSLY